MLTALLSLTRTLIAPRGCPARFFNISTFLSTFFPLSADNKDRTQ